jgi:hypothetical protein
MGFASDDPHVYPGIYIYYLKNCFRGSKKSSTKKPHYKVRLGKKF